MLPDVINMDDVGVASDKACPCGRGLPLLAALKGRITDVIFTRSGKSIPGIALPWGLFASLGVEQFQIVQESYQRVVVKVVLGGEYSKERAKKVNREIISQYQPILGEDMDIAVEFVDHIIPTREGKRRLVISNLPPPGKVSNSV